MDAFQLLAGPMDESRFRFGLPAINRKCCPNP